MRKNDDTPTPQHNLLDRFFEDPTIVVNVVVTRKSNGAVKHAFKATDDVNTSGDVSCYRYASKCLIKFVLNWNLHEFKTVRFAKGEPCDPDLPETEDVSRPALVISTDLSQCPTVHDEQVFQGFERDLFGQSVTISNENAENAPVNMFRYKANILVQRRDDSVEKLRPIDPRIINR